MRTHRLWALAAAIALAGGARGEPAPPVVVPSETPAPAVQGLGPLDGAQAFGISADLGVAAAAVPLDRDRQRSVLRIARGSDAPREVVLPGRAVALSFAPAGDVLFLVVQDLARKGDIVSVRLLRFDVAAVKVSGAAPLPATATGIAIRNGGDAVLVASRDEVRTFLLPALVSGALYRVPGNNRAVAPLAGSTRALIAQGTRLVLVDLAATQGRAGLPILAELPLAAAPRALCSSPDSPDALLLDESGSLQRVSIDPLALAPAGHASALAWPGGRVAAPPPASGDVAAQRVETVPPPPSTVPAPIPVPEAVAPVVTEPPVPAAPDPAAAPPPAGSVSGRILGSREGGAATIVAYGPDNILKEAARSRPGPDGVWRFDSLPPGGYRFVAVGEGGRVLICDPPYVNAKVGPEAGRELPVMKILGEAR